LHPYQQDTLDWLGLKGRYRPTSERHLLVEEFYFTSPTTMTGCYDPLLAPFLRRHFLGQADKAFDSPRRFYIQRVGASRGAVNEAEITDFFRKKGWAIVDTQALTMAQQIQLFARAEALCTVHGAALTNLLWCQPGCRVLELFADNFLNGVYEGIARYVGVQHRFLVYPGDATFRIRVHISDLEREYPFLAG
jgi:capsular polysaccharide biosynthesis protein